MIARETRGVIDYEGIREQIRTIAADTLLEQAAAVHNLARQLGDETYTREHGELLFGVAQAMRITAETWQRLLASWNVFGEREDD